MSLKLISRARLPRLAGPACVLLLGLAGAVGCSAYPTVIEMPINCSADSDYDFDPNEVPPRACFADSTAGHNPDASTNPTTETIEGGGRCGSPQAVVLRASHYNDWGSTCGFYDGWSPTARNESDYDGLSFWARAPGNTSKAFTISISDANTTDITQGGNCRTYSAVDGGIAGATITAFQDPSNPNAVISGSGLASRLPDECGNNTRTNAYNYVMSVTAEWDFYPIPFSQFTQSAYPNRVPNSVLTAGDVPGTGLLRSKIFGFDIRPPKEAAFELWLDKIRFYKKKHTAGVDAAAGADAAAGPVGSGGAMAGTGGAPGGAGGATAGTGGAPGGTGGSTGSTPTDGVACTLPTNPLITDFTYTPVDGGATDFVHFGDSTTLQGTEYVYPTSGSKYPVTSDVTQSNWHLSGTLGDYSGFGLHFDNCSRIDASAYLGIQFTISGSVAAPPAQGGSIVTLGMGTLNDAITYDWLKANGDTTTKAGDPGRCVPTSGSGKYSQPTCADAKKDIPITATPTPIRVLWNQFTGGKPEPGVTPTDIISIYWYFPNPAGVGTAAVVPYPVDIVIDDLQFITP